jgi:hypothetical protein
LRDGVLAVLAELCGEPECPGKVDEATLQAIIDADREVPVIEQVRDIAKRYWSL